MDEHWRDTVELRGIETWDSIAYPPNAPFTVRQDWRKDAADADPVATAKATLDRFGFAYSICNSLFPVQSFRDENLAAVFARALNDWLAAEWLAKDARLRGSAVLPIQSVERSVEEIERRADDPRFVQVLMLAMGEHPLGKPMYGPVYAAAERHGFTVGIHAGSSYHHALTGSGWPTYYLEDYASQSLGFHTQVGSLVCEGVFVKFPKLKVVLIESGVTWLPPYLWRLSKFWRGVRNEVPWIDRSPEEYVRDHIRLTIQPFDAPPSAAQIGRIMDQLQSDDMLLFATDFPHWQFDGADMLPAGIPLPLRRKILIENSLATYPRLGRPT
jgi:predicted TIM-barrel fold metal-dependent hydrolase